MSHWTEDQQLRFREILEAQDRGECKVAYWNSDAYGFPANHDCQDLKWRAEPGKIQEVAGPLELCSSKALHATLEPHKWKGFRVWIVALWGEIKMQNDKLGALTREIIGEILPHEVFNESIGIRLGRKDLAGAKLSGAYLVRAYLVGANLTRANLFKAYLVGANLTGANLAGADLSRADLSRADLSRANLSRANLSEALLSRAKLAGADLSRAYLYGASLSEADLSRADLSRADLSRANLSGANLSGVNLAGAYVGPDIELPGWKNDNGWLDVDRLNSLRINK